MIHRVTSLFPLWAVLFSALAYGMPWLFAGLKPAIVPLLGVVMFGMGMTLTWSNFAEVLKRPGVVGLGVFLQYLVMPLAAWLVARLLGLPPYLMAGLVLVGACPGGTASNVVCYLARGDVALSITLTTASTLLAIVMTPLLTWLYVGQQVPVPVQSMLWSIFRIVLLPVSLGVLTNRLLGGRLHSVKPLFPLLSVLAIVVIIAIVVALNRGNLATMGAAVALAVILHNLLGLACGYGLPRLLGLEERICRTLAIEVGMQNSGLGVALAVKYFSAAAALPGALFSIWHNLSRVDAGGVLVAVQPSNGAGLSHARVPGKEILHPLAQVRLPGTPASLGGRDTDRLPSRWESLPMTTPGRGLGYWEVTSIGVGEMVGGGIFAVLGLSVHLAQGGAPLAFLIAGIVALVTAYSYVQLSVTFPSQGGTVSFLDRAFGPGVVTGSLNILLWISYMVMLSLYAYGFGSYGASLFPAESQGLWKHLLITAAWLRSAG